MEVRGFSDRSGPFTNNISGSGFRVVGEHGKGIAVFLREFGKAPQREGTYELCFEGMYNITKLGGKETGRKGEFQGDGSTGVG